MSAPQRPGRPPMSGGRTAVVVVVSVVGGLLVVFGLLYAAFLLFGPGAPTAAPPSNQQVAATLCTALDANPTGDRYSLAVTVIPPDRTLGLVGNAQSYRQAARLIDGFCPRNFQQAELLRGMARIYDPSGG